MPSNQSDIKWPRVGFSYHTSDGCIVTPTDLLNDYVLVRVLNRDNFIYSALYTYAGLLKGYIHLPYFEGINENITKH